MARNHGKIETGIWQNRRVRALTEDARTLLIYLYTSPHSTAASAYVLPMSYASHDLQWTPERVQEGFRQLSLKPFALRDEATEVVFLAGWWEHNKPENPNVAGYAAKLLLALPDCQLKANAIKDMRDEVKYTDAIYKVLGEWSWEPSQEELPLRLPEPSPPGFRQSRAEQSQSISEPNLTEQDARSRSRRPKGSRISPDWKPSDDCRAYATERGLNPQEIDDEAREFVAYWLGADAKDPLKRDWDSAWKRRIRDVAHRIIQRRPRGQGATSGTNGTTPPPETLYAMARVYLCVATGDGKSWKPKPPERRYWAFDQPGPGQPGCVVADAVFQQVAKDYGAEWEPGKPRVAA